MAKSKRPDGRLRVGVIGIGRMGLYHLNKYKEMPNVEVAGVFDPNPESCALLAQQQPGVTVFSSLAELLFESDAVSIASPTDTHFAVAVQALEAGTHVLIEKPIASTVEQAERIVSLGKEKGLVVQVGHVERFRLAGLLEGVHIDQPRFIEAHRLSSSLGREPNIDVVSDLMIHDLDLALDILRQDPQEVFAIGMPVVTNYFDIANVRMEFGGGAVVNLNASRVSNQPQRKFRVFGRNAYVSVDFLLNEAQVFERRENKIIESRVNTVSEDFLQLQCNHFLECVRSGASPLVCGEDGLRALKFTQTVIQKLEQRQKLLDAKDRSSAPEGLSGDNPSL